MKTRVIAGIVAVVLAVVGTVVLVCQWSNNVAQLVTLPLCRQRGTRTRPRTILRYRHCDSLN